MAVLHAQEEETPRRSSSATAAALLPPPSFLHFSTTNPSPKSQHHHHGRHTTTIARSRSVHRTSSSSLFHSLLLSFSPPNPTAHHPHRPGPAAAPPPPPLPRSPPPNFLCHASSPAQCASATSPPAHRRTNVCAPTLMMPSSVVGKKKPPGYVSQEPASPEVTCIGRVRRNKHCKAWDALLGGSGDPNRATRDRRTKLSAPPPPLAHSPHNRSAAAAIPAANIMHLIVPRPLLHSPIESNHYSSSEKKFVSAAMARHLLPVYLYRKCSNSGNQLYDLALDGLLRRVTSALSLRPDVRRQIPFKNSLVAEDAVPIDVAGSSVMHGAPEPKASRSRRRLYMFRRMKDLGASAAAESEEMQSANSSGTKVGSAPAVAAASATQLNNNCLPLTFAPMSNKVCHSGDGCNHVDVAG